MANSRSPLLLLYLIFLKKYDIIIIESKGCESFMLSQPYINSGRLIPFEIEEI